MNFQGSRRRKGLFSAQCDSGKDKGVHQSVVTQRTRTKDDATQTTPGSLRLKYLQIARERGEQSSATRLPHSKHCEKSTPKKFHEVKVYRSFMGEKETGDSVERSKSCESTSDQKTPEKVTSRNLPEGTTKASHTSRFTHSNHAVRRYALYRGMLCQ